MNALASSSRMGDVTSDALAAIVAQANERVRRLEAPSDRPRPVILPTYSGCRRLPNLTALLALLLRRYDVPVLLHGSTQGGPDFGRVTTAAVMAELGFYPVRSIEEAQRRIRDESLVFVPAALLFGDLAPLAARYRGEPAADVLQAVAKLLDPFAGAGFRIVSMSQPQTLAALREFLIATRADALLLRGSDGEPFANPRTPSAMEWFERGEPHTLNACESDASASPPALPSDHDAPATARWTAAALSGEAPIPLSILNQLACCLHGARLRVSDSD